MTTQSSNFPNREKLLAPDGLTASRPLIWFRDLRADVDSASITVKGGAVTLSSQTGSVTTTPFDTPELTSGQYRVSSFSQVTTPASINSSLTVTFSFTRNAKACTVSSPAMTSNDSTKPVGFVDLISIDDGTPVSYSTTYVSNAAGMVYSTDLVLERVNA